MRGTAAIVLVFDLVNFDSFNKLDYYLETARNGAGNVPILLVGNKSDLESEEELGQVIQQSEIDDWMRLNQITDFMKTSAKTGENVRKAFEKLTIMSLVDLGEKPRLGEVREEGFLFKVVVIGAAGVGKTSIVHRFTENVFLQDYKLTVGVDFIVKNLDVDEDLLPADVLKNLNVLMEEAAAKKAAFPEKKSKSPLSEPEVQIESTSDSVKEPVKKPETEEIPPENEIGVTYNKQMTRNSRNKFTFCIKSEHFFIENYVEITIKPEFPGCIVTPDEIVLDQAKPKERIEFNITPVSVGNLDDACMKILHNKKQRYLFHTPSKVVSLVPTWTLFVLSLVLLSLGPLFGETYFKGIMLGALSITLITVVIGALLLLISFTLFFIAKQKHTEHASFVIKE
jgi:GTPase SAR1 family protein